MVIDLMDLNVIALKDEEVNFIDYDSATSNSSVVNGDAGEANSNASNDDTFSGHVFTFNFGILQVNVAGGEADEEVLENTRDFVTRTGFVTRELFPVSGITESCRSWSPDLPLVPQRRQQQQKPPPQVKKGRRGPRSRSSEYRGVTFYRRTGRWESHIWDCGKQIYLGGFDTAHSAARAYDRAAIQFRGAGADINFTLCDYEEDLEQMKHLSKEEFVHILRRQSNGSSRRSSKYRAVANGKFGKWEAQTEEFLGKKAHEKAAMVCNGRESVTNFVPSSYESEVISNLPIEVSHHDLDLNLGISNNSSKETGSQRDLKYHPYDVQNRKIQKIDSSRTTNNLPLRGRPLISEIAQLRTGVCSNSAPICKEIMAQDRIGVASSEGPPKWAWQMQGQLRATPMTVVSTAASSGFSSPVTTGFSASSHLSKAHNPTALNLCFSSYRA